MQRCRAVFEVEIEKSGLGAAEVASLRRALGEVTPEMASGFSSLRLCGVGGCAVELVLRDEGRAAVVDDPRLIVHHVLLALRLAAALAALWLLLSVAGDRVQERVDGCRQVP